MQSGGHVESEWSSALHGQCDEQFIQRPGSMRTIGAPPPNPQDRNIHTMPKLCVGQIQTLQEHRRQTYNPRGRTWHERWDSD